jgi:uncharacterized protein YecT (DUF1311 family)
MKRFVVLLLFVAVACSCHGQSSSTLDVCMNVAGSQRELNQCASDEAKRADTELNTKYKNFLTQIAGDTLAVTKLKVAERAWLRYRDAYLDATYPAQNKQANYGTEYPMDVNLLRAKLTREHVAALTDLINEYQPAE